MPLLRWHICMFLLSQQRPACSFFVTPSAVTAILELWLPFEPAGQVRGKCLYDVEHVGGNTHMSSITYPVCNNDWNYACTSPNSTSTTGFCACSVKDSSEEVKAVKLPLLEDLFENIQTATTEIENHSVLHQLAISHAQPLLRSHIPKLEPAYVKVMKGLEVPALFMP